MIIFWGNKCQLTLFNNIILQYIHQQLHFITKYMLSISENTKHINLNFQQMPLSSISFADSYYSLMIRTTPSNFQQLPTPLSYYHLPLQLHKHIFLVLCIHLIWINYKCHHHTIIAKHVSKLWERRISILKKKKTNFREEQEP